MCVIAFLRTYANDGFPSMHVSLVQRPLHAHAYLSVAQRPSPLMYEGDMASARACVQLCGIFFFTKASCIIKQAYVPLQKLIWAH